MSKLTDFLLARIAEDEDGIFRVAGGMDESARAAREVKAKRRIVGWATAEEGGPDPEVADILTTVLGFLVAVYADHPDYREEWA